MELNIHAILVLNTDENKPYSKKIAVYCENVNESSQLLIHVHSLTVRGPTIDLEEAIIERVITYKVNNKAVSPMAMKYRKRIGFDVLPVLAGKVTVFNTRVKDKLVPANSEAVSLYQIQYNQKIV